MNSLIPIDEFGLSERNGKPVVSSRYIAEIFQKRHDNVLRDIADILNSQCGSSEDFTALNFEVSKYKDSTGRKQPEYLMTRDGFTLLAMGFTGKKAMQFKITYIKRFNEMESFIKSLSSAKTEFPEFTAAIMMAHEEPKHYHFSNECNMINQIILGMNAKQFREANGIESGQSIRPYLGLDQIKAIETLQRADIGLVLTVQDFHERKNVLEKFYQAFSIKKLVA